jgi:hypothetical protein
MSQNGPTNEDVHDLAADEPVIVVGEPRSLRGELRLHNTGKEKIVLREARLRSAALPGSIQKVAGRMVAPDAQVSLSAVIHPGQSQRVAITLDLEQHTPPGEYHGELEVAGRTRPFIMHVAEAVKLSISPKQLVIDRGSGAKVVKRVVFSNDGNVPLTLGVMGRVLLGEELPFSLGARASISAADKRAKGLEQLFSEVIRDDASAITAPVGSLTIRNPGAPVVLQPGDVSTLDLEIVLPEGLKTNSRYRGRLPLYTADLEFVIVPVADEAKFVPA